jgi:glycosyltransferase involved in cell wall biosynthesis
MKLSIIIPVDKDPFTNKTIGSILQNASGEIEVIPVLDGVDVEIIDDPRVKVVKLDKKEGMRGAINAGIKASKGDFIMKCDSHCLFAPNFDNIMTNNCEVNWLLIPSRFSLNDTENWVRDDSRPVRNYHYLSFPGTGDLGYGLSFGVADWNEMNEKRRQYDIDDTMSFQGSCWMAYRPYFMAYIGLLDDRPETYGTFAQEQEEIGLKYWLGGGNVKVIKKTWYAHLSKRTHHYKDKLFDREYKSKDKTINGHVWSTKHWMNNEEPYMRHPFSWLVEKFWPIPGWPADWQEQWDKLNKI